MDKEKVYLYVDVGEEVPKYRYLQKVAGSKLLNPLTWEPSAFWMDRIRRKSGRISKEWVKTHTSDHEEVYGIGTGGNINKLSRLVNNGVDKALAIKNSKVCMNI